MLILYRLSVIFYLAALNIASPFIVKARLMVHGRRNWKQTLREKCGNAGGYIWFHCASVGEFEQGRPLLEKIKNENPGQKILLSFFSSSGYEMRKNYALADAVVYLPWDSPKNAKAFCRIVKPGMLILIKYDLWYYHIREARRAGAEVYLVSGIFRNNHWLFRFRSSFAERLFGYFRWLFVQDENSMHLLQQHRVGNCSVAGDTRYDRVIEIASQPFDDAIIRKFAEGSPVLIAGSTWPEDEKMLHAVYRSCGDTYKYIIVPHEIHPQHIRQLCSLFGDALLYSEARSGEAENARVLIVDTMGMLSKIYRYGSLAYIGGGFGNGIHNTIEAAVYGIPVLFGPKYQKFREAEALIQCGAAFSINSSEELTETVKRFGHSQNDAAQSGDAARRHVYSQEGSVSKIYDKIIGSLR